MAIDSSSRIESRKLRTIKLFNRYLVICIDAHFAPQSSMCFFGDLVGRKCVCVFRERLGRSLGIGSAGAADGDAGVRPNC